MKTNALLLSILCGLLLPSCQTKQDNTVLEQQILETGLAIRTAFAAEDVAAIKALHHPEVIKALGYDNLQTGRKEVMEGLEETLRNFSLEFVENDVESILIRDDIAIEQTKFRIKGSPKSGGEPFFFAGRTMVTYQRYAESPTGWASIREIIQPATD